MQRIFTIIMHDGSRYFGDLPQTVLWEEMRDHIATMPGAIVTGFVCDYVLEAWIDFTYAGHAFSVNDQYGDYWFFVDDPACPEHLLVDVLDHCETLLGSSR